ncbi:PDDEXK nuclease domain-containing protein [Chloroflexota bacterium]
MCEATLQKMRTGLELLEEDREITAYFFNSSPLWKKTSCTPRGTGVECPNEKLCEEREARQEPWVCRGLLEKLGIYSQENLQILEREIGKVILNNLADLDWSMGEALRYHSREPSIPIGRPDILLKGSSTETLYVIELKAGIASREDVGQLQSYVGYYREHLPKQFKDVKGILVAQKVDDRARYAIAANPILSCRNYKLSVDIEPA